MVLPIRSRNKTSEHAVENERFTKTKKKGINPFLFVFPITWCTVYFKLIKQEQIVNQHYYLNILTRLPNAFHKNRPKYWSNNWFFHHDNNPVHQFFFFGLKTNRKVRPFALFVRFRTLWFVIFHKNENCNEWMPFFWCFLY